MSKKIGSLFIASVVLICTACGSARTYTIPAPSNSLDCAASQIAQAGYEIFAGGQDDGYVRAYKRGAGAIGEYISATSSSSELTVRVWREKGFSNNPTDEMKKDAESVMEECGNSSEVSSS